MFKNVSDIIVRYEALTEAKSFLGERQNKELASLESARAEMVSTEEVLFFLVIPYLEG